MKPQVLNMPDYIAKLVRGSLAQLGLESSDATDDMIMCPLIYESGATVSIIVMCTTERGWFNRIKPTISLSFVTLDGDTRATTVHFNETMSLPTGPSDLQFLLRFAATVRAAAWTLAVIGGMGECISLPGRPSA